MGKKALSVLLATLLVLSLAACGGGQASSGSTANAEAAPAASTESAGGAEETAEEPPADNGETVTLTMWHIQTLENVSALIERSMERFEADNPGYEVEVTAMQNDPYKTKLITAMGANEMPDIFIHWTGGPMISYIESGAVADITSYMEADGYKDKFLDAAITQATYKDSIWAVPVETVAPALMFYNKDVFAANGVEPPTTFAEFEQVCDTLLAAGVVPVTVDNKTKWPGAVFYGYMLDRIAGPTAFADAVNGDVAFDSPDFQTTAAKLQEWANKGYFGTDFNALDHDSGQSRQQFYNDDAAMYVMGSWFLFNALSESPDSMEKIGVMPFPVMEGGKGAATEYIGTIGDNFYSVSSSSEHPDMAFKAITYMLDEESIQDRIEAGKIPPLKDVELQDDVSKMIMDEVSSATYMQLWLDQYLPPNDAELHKDELQKLYAGTVTPEEYNQAMAEGITGQ